MTRYIEQRRGVLGVEPVFRVLDVPVSTFYARRSRVPSRRELEHRQLLVEVEAARVGYRRAYGARKTWKELRRRGINVGRDRVARVMHRAGLEGKRRGAKKRTTIADETALERARDLLQRDFAAGRPNEKWVCDITYLRTWSGFVYVAFLLDCFSRMIVGWQLATHMCTDLVLDALEMANGLRRPDAGLIAHSDRGSQHTSIRYTDRARRARRRALGQSRGDAYDTRWPRPGSQPSSLSSSTAAASPATSTPNTSSCTGSASPTRRDCTKHSATCRPRIRASG